MKKLSKRIMAVCMSICVLVTGSLGTVSAEDKTGAAMVNYYDVDKLFTYNRATGINRQTPVDTVSVWDAGGLQISTDATGSAANGASATLVPAMSGDIQFAFSPIPKVVADGVNTYAFRKLTFRFRDLQNPDNYFDYVVHNYNRWSSDTTTYEYIPDNVAGTMGCVEYNGVVKANRTGDNINGMDNGVLPFGDALTGSFVGKTRCGQISYFRWNAMEKQILAYSNDWTFHVVADLDDSAYGFGKEFSGFDYYSVEIMFDEVQDGEKGGVLISEMIMPCYASLSLPSYDGAQAGSLWCAKDLSTRTDTTAPKVFKNQLGDLGIKSSAFTLENRIQAVDFETGFLQLDSLNPNVKLYYGHSESERKVAENGKIPNLKEEGTYHLYASVTDSNGNASEVTWIGSFTWKNYYDVDKLFSYNRTIGINRQTPVDTVSLWDAGGLQISTDATGSAANGASATLVPAMSGDIQFAFSPVPKVVADGVNTYAFRKLTFRFHDLQNPDNYFDYVVHNYNRWSSDTTTYEYIPDNVAGTMGCVEYNGVVKANRTGDNINGMDNGVLPFGDALTGSFVGKTRCGQISYFRWNAMEKQILAYSNDWTFHVVADLDDSAYGFGKEFSGFDYYSVEIMFDEVQDGEKGGVLITEMIMPCYASLSLPSYDGAQAGSLWCAKDLSTRTDTTAPKVVENQFGSLKCVNGEYQLPSVIHAYDFETGWIGEEIGSSRLELSYKKSEDSNVVVTPITSQTFSAPEEVGAYEIYAKVKDINGNLSAETLVGEFTVVNLNGSITLQNNITVNFYADFGTLQPTDASMEVTMNDKTTLLTADGEDNTYGKKFSFAGVNPQCMGTDMLITMHYTIDGKEESKILSGYSVQAYLTSLLNSSESNDTLKTLINDTLLYGGAAQKYMNYKTDQLVSDGIMGSEFVKPENETDGVYIPLSASSTVVGYQWNSATIVMSSAGALRLYFKAPDIQNVTITIGENTFTSSDFKNTTTSGMYYVEVTRISAASFGNKITATLKVNDENAQTLHYSINTYVSRKWNSENENLKEFVQCLYNYGKSAKAYVDADSRL